MRLILLSAALALFASCNQNSTNSSNNGPIPDNVAENYKGQVKHVKTETYKIDSATGKMGSLDSKSEEDFDDNGYIKTYIYSDGKDSMTTKSTYDHNAKGYLTGMTTTGNGKKKSSLKLEMDKDGKYTIAKSYDLTDKMDVFYTDITTNKFGELTGAKGHHPDSTLKMAFTNTFDSIYYVGGNTTDSVGKVTFSNKTTLNDKKDPGKQEETSVTKGVATNAVTTFIYDTWDKQGNWTQQTQYNDKGKKIKVVKRTIQYK